jgi:hypothetical protein
MRKLKALVLSSVLSLPVGIALSGEANAYSRSNCETIKQELLRQGASNSTANWLGYRVAWRESGCTPQFVRDRDDHSYSRFGLNGKTAGLRRAWRNLCNADVRYDTRILSIDVRCALAAYRALGARPWGGY